MQYNVLNVGGAVIGDIKLDDKATVTDFWEALTNNGSISREKASIVYGEIVLLYHQEGKLSDLLSLSLTHQTTDPGIIYLCVRDPRIELALLKLATGASLEELVRLQHTGRLIVDREVLLAAVSQNGAALRHADGALQQKFRECSKDDVQRLLSAQRDSNLLNNYKSKFSSNGFFSQQCPPFETDHVKSFCLNN